MLFRSLGQGRRFHKETVPARSDRHSSARRRPMNCRRRSREKTFRQPSFVASDRLKIRSRREPAEVDRSQALEIRVVRAREPRSGSSRSHEYGRVSRSRLRAVRLPHARPMQRFASPHRGRCRDARDRQRVAHYRPLSHDHRRRVARRVRRRRSHRIYTTRQPRELPLADSHVALSASRVALLSAGAWQVGGGRRRALSFSAARRRPRHYSSLEAPTTASLADPFGFAVAASAARIFTEISSARSVCSSRNALEFSRP